MKYRKTNDGRYAIHNTKGMTIVEVIDLRKWSGGHNGDRALTIGHETLAGHTGPNRPVWAVLIRTTETPSAANGYRTTYPLTFHGQYPLLAAAQSAGMAAVAGTK